MLKEILIHIFDTHSDSEFNELALKIFQFQYSHNTIYQQFVDLNVPDIHEIDQYLKIPFLPVSFFKTHKIICRDVEPELTFYSSATGNNPVSSHPVASLSLYEKSFTNSFEYFYGKPDQYLILALLPSYLDRHGSSLVYMVEKLIRESLNNNSGFYLNNYHELNKTLQNTRGQNVLLLGVSFALLEFAEKYKPDIPDVIVMETGGMKGRRKEMVREELHAFLCQSFNVPHIHSEYGMTELLSQAYSKGNGIFGTPPWMKIVIRDVNDPKTLTGNHKTGGINIIDFANIYSCSFIATDDLGRTHDNGTFEVLGRFDESDIRGCNLLLE